MELYSISSYSFLWNLISAKAIMSFSQLTFSQKVDLRISQNYETKSVTFFILFLNKKKLLQCQNSDVM